MDHAKYICDKKELNGLYALIRKDAEGDEYILAQFDDINLCHLAYGWHRFNKNDFIIYEEE